MAADVLIVVILAFIVFEVFEHVVIPLAAICTGRRRRPLTGAEGMIGKVGEVRRWTGRSGTISVNGELWNARGSDALAVGDAVAVIAVDHLTLVVEPVRPSVASDDRSASTPAPRALPGSERVHRG